MIRYLKLFLGYFILGCLASLIVVIVLSAKGELDSSALVFAYLTSAKVGGLFGCSRVLYLIIKNKEYLNEQRN